VTDPILALSDLLVLTALERAWARAVKRGRYHVPAATRHNQYLRTVIDETLIDSALRDAWALVPLLAVRHGLGVDPYAWTQTLDSYTRALVMAQEPHSPARLAPLLTPLTVEAVYG